MKQQRVGEELGRPAAPSSAACGKPCLHLFPEGRRPS